MDARDDRPGTSGYRWPNGRAVARELWNTNEPSLKNEHCTGVNHGGKMLDAKWKRGSNLDPFHIVDSNNNILYVPKGKVWISLVPNTKNPSFG